jgi:hypothetical protein
VARTFVESVFPDQLVEHAGADAPRERRRRRAHQEGFRDAPGQASAQAEARVVDEPSRASCRHAKRAGHGLERFSEEVEEKDSLALRRRQAEHLAADEHLHFAACHDLGRVAGVIGSRAEFAGSGFGRGLAALRTETLGPHETLEPAAEGRGLAQGGKLPPGDEEGFLARVACRLRVPAGAERGRKRHFLEALHQHRERRVLLANRGPGVTGAQDQVGNQVLRHVPP